MKKRHRKIVTRISNNRKYTKVVKIQKVIMIYYSRIVNRYTVVKNVDNDTDDSVLIDVNNLNNRYKVYDKGKSIVKRERNNTSTVLYQVNGRIQ